MWHCVYYKNIYHGVVAQLARALVLHTRGRGFDSHQLHSVYGLFIGWFFSDAAVETVASDE